MKHKNKYILLIALLSTVLFLSACGGDAQEQVEEAVQQVEEQAEEVVDTAATAAAEAAAAAEEEAAAAAEEAAAAAEEAAAAAEEAAAAAEEEAAAAEEEAAPEVFLTVWADETRAPILQELIDEFEATYGVGLIVEQVANINDDFPIAAPAGEGPDIFLGPHDRLGGWAASGLVAPIDLGDKQDQFIDVSLNAFTLDGQLYGMPYAIENMGFFRNTDLVPEAPQTWDEVIEVGATLQESGDVSYGLVVEGNGYKVYPILTSFGGYVFGQDENGNWLAEDLGVDSEGMIAAGDWMAEQVASGVMSDNTDGETATALFESGEVPFIMDGPWNLGRYRDSGIPFEISPFPSDGQPFGGVQGFMINALSDNVLLAQAFLTEFVATEDVMEQLYLTGDRPSTFVPVLETTDDSDLAAFGEAGANASLMPAIPEMGAVWGSWNDAVVLVITGGDESANAFNTAASQIREVIGGAFTGMVNVPGSWQAAAGCEADWDPACEVTALTEGDDGLFTGSFDIPAGDYEAKVALDGAWTLNYGVDGEADGPNYTFSMATDGAVTYSYDPETNILTITTE
ncbi:MAG: extracellular solute-binding protein [Chloroflexi bacterium]|nr:extracellular solute-binding protein [Chloroflexota bacterium]